MEDFYRYIYFQTLDYCGTPTTSGYTLPITPFTFIPIFDDGLSIDYSNQNILWDFGDGTTSSAVTAVHSFKIPGWYNVKCYVLGKGGEGYTDKFSQNILVQDYIADNIVLHGLDGKTESGTYQNPFIAYRFNSWQSYPLLSSEGYKLKLNVNGNVAPFLDAETYKKDKWAHLKPTSRFESVIYNVNSNLEERTTVDYLQTTNKEIYVKLDRFKNIVFCDKNDVGSCFAGTSGSKEFWFIDDIPSIQEGEPPIEVFATFDTTKFVYNLDKIYPETEYPLLNSVYGTSTVKKVIEQLNSDHLTITSNGIDDDNNGNLIDTFNIYDTKFTNQKIPFVVRFKSTKNGKELAAKYNPILTYNSNLSELSAGQVYVVLRDKDNQIVPNVTINSNFGVLSAESYGGYFKGYFQTDMEMSDVHLYAKSIPVLKERYVVDSTYAFFGHPQSSNSHRITINPSIDNPIDSKVRDDIVSVDSLTGVYTSCVTYFRDLSGVTTSYVWLVDSDQDRVITFNVLSSPDTGITINLPQNSSPSDICADNLGNVWVTLYDSISTVRINRLSNQIDKVIKPKTANGILNGENKVAPASIDIDIDGNIFISYSTQGYSFVEKYTSDGIYINRSAKILDPPSKQGQYQLTQIVTDLKGNLWGILKDNKATNTSVLSAKQDKVVKLDANGVTKTYYDIGGSLWNITVDVKDNIWVTKNRNEVVKINLQTQNLDKFKLPSDSLDSPFNYTSDLEGIACTTRNTIMVIDNANKRLHYFNGDTDTYGFSAKYIDLQDTGISKPYIQNKANGYGDWNGFKYINRNKNLHIYPTLNSIFGRSNNFSIYSSVSGKYSIEKINENFDAKEQIKSYRFQDYLADKDVLFNDFIGTCLGDIHSKSQELGKTTYEKIANFTDNIATVDTCNIKALKSMYDMLDEDFYTFNNYYTDSNIPAELGRLMDLFSVKFSKLKGSRDKYKYNFDDKGYYNEEIIRNGGIPLFGINKGKELNFFTAILTAGNPIIAYEKFSGEYKYLDTNVLSSSYLTYIDPIHKTYSLSAYNDHWGWGLSLPDSYTSYDMPKYYTFFQYNTGYVDDQTEGIINWQSDNTNIIENLSSVEEWDYIREEMILYSLAKGLSVIK